MSAAARPLGSDDPQPSTAKAPAGRDTEIESAAGPLDDPSQAFADADADADEPGLQPSAGPASAPAAAASQSSLAYYTRAVRAIRTLGAEEEVELVAAARNGDAQARRRLIECHLGLVVAVARGYSRMSMPIEDLIEEGNLGLMEAVGRFDPERGVRFATYARWWIREAINNAMTTQSRTVRLPSHVVRGIAAVRQAERKLDSRAAHERAAVAPHPEGQAGGASLREIAQATGRPAVNVAQLMTLAQGPLSLNAPFEGASDTSLQDGLCADPSSEPDSAVLTKELLATVLSLVDRLPSLERVVIVQRFGFGSGEPRTLEDIGASVQLTAERVRQIQVQALLRMREMLANRGIDAKQFF